MCGGHPARSRRSVVLRGAEPHPLADRLVANGQHWAIRVAHYFVGGRYG